jgi:hypothetical protein
MFRQVFAGKDYFKGGVLPSWNCTGPQLTKATLSPKQLKSWE